MGGMELTDTEIERLLGLAKTISNPGARKLAKRGSLQVNYDATAATGEKFKVYVRQNLRIPEGFSCGLLYLPVSGESVTLTRYNGSDHEHTNPLDDSERMVPSCHIHRATERYMRAGRKAEHYAEATTRYTDLAGALQALLKDCNIQGLPAITQTLQLL